MNSLPTLYHFSTHLKAHGSPALGVSQTIRPTTTAALPNIQAVQSSTGQQKVAPQAPTDFRQALHLSSRAFLPWTLQTNAASQPHYFLHMGPVEKGDVGKIKGLSATWGTPLSKASALLMRLLNFDKGTLEWARLEDESATVPQTGALQQATPQQEARPVIKASLVTIHPEQTKLWSWLLGALSSKGPAEPLAPVALMSCPAAPPTEEGKLHLKTLIVQTRQQLQKAHPNQRVYALVPQQHVPEFLEIGFKIANPTTETTDQGSQTAQTQPPDAMAAFLQKHFENDTVQLLTFNT